MKVEVNGLVPPALPGSILCKKEPGYEVNVIYLWRYLHWTSWSWSSCWCSSPSHPSPTHRRWIINSVTHTHTHSHTHSLSLSLSLTHTHTLSHSQSWCVIQARHWCHSAYWWQSFGNHSFLQWERLSPSFSLESGPMALCPQRMNHFRSRQSGSHWAWNI